MPKALRSGSCRVKACRTSQKVARSGGFFKDFQHLYTSVNGVGKRDIHIRDSSSAILPVVAHLCCLRERSNDTRHVAALAVHRWTLIVGIGFPFYPTSCRYWRKSQ